MQEYTRVDRPQAAAAGYYSALAPWYDLLAASEKKFIRRGLDLLAPRSGEWVLEVGSGTGFAQRHILQAIGQGVSVGLDLSPGMARISKHKLARAGLGTRLNLAISNSLPIPFPDQTFDGVFSSFTLELFDTPDLQKVLAEFHRVLKPGGRLVLVCLSKDRPLPLMGRIYETLHDRWPRLLDCRPIPALQLVSQAGFNLGQALQASMWGLPVITLESRK